MAKNWFTIYREYNEKPIKTKQKIPMRAKARQLLTAFPTKYINEMPQQSVNCPVEQNHKKSKATYFFGFHVYFLK